MHTQMRYDNVFRISDLSSLSSQLSSSSAADHSNNNDNNDDDGSSSSSSSSSSLSSFAYHLGVTCNDYKVTIDHWQLTMNP